MRRVLLEHHAGVHEDDKIADLAGEADLVGDATMVNKSRASLRHDVEGLAEELGIQRVVGSSRSMNFGCIPMRGDRDALLLTSLRAKQVGLHASSPQDPTTTAAAARW